MKKTILFLVLILMASFAIAQQVTDVVPIVHTTGQTPLEFLTANMWNLILLAFLVLSEWLGTTGKVKEGSIWAWIINMVGKLIRSKTSIVDTKKAKFMSVEEVKKVKGLKIVVLMVLLSGVGLSLSAQDSPWNGFFKPVPKDVITAQKSDNPMAILNPFKWKFRPAAEMTAIQVLYDKSEKLWTSSTFHSAGVGLGIQHYVEGPNGPVNNYGFNALLMLDATPIPQKSAGFGVAITVNIPNFVTFGGGYNATFKQPYALIGAVYNF